MRRWKGKGGRKIVEVVGRWNGKGERKVGEVYILKKINVKTIIEKLERKKKPLKLERLQSFVLFCFLFFLIYILKSTPTRKMKTNSFP